MLLALFLFAAQLLPGQSEDLAAKFAQARQLMASGRFEEAIPIYRQMVKAEPGNPGLLLNLGLAQHMAGHEREAIPTFEAVLKAQPDSLPALISLGSARLALNQPAEAIAPLRKAVAAKPADLETRGLLASALLDAKRLDEAGVEYRKLTDSASEDPRVWYGLGMTYQAAAASAFEQLQKADATSPYVAALVADTRVQRRQFRSGFFFYNEAAKQLPNLHGIHASLADVYRKTGHSDWAARGRCQGARAARRPTASPSGGVPVCRWPRLADPHPAAPRRLVAGSPLLAREGGQRTCHAGAVPAGPTAAIGGTASASRGDRARSGPASESAREWREALALLPGNPRLRRELAESLFMAQDYRAALAEVEPLLKNEPKSPELNFIAGDSLLRSEEPEKALPYLKTALASDPGMLAADASLGLALSRLGNHAEAIAPPAEGARTGRGWQPLLSAWPRLPGARAKREKAAGAMAKYQEILKKAEEQKEEVAREAQIGPPR